MNREAKLEALYSQLPSLDCLGLCSESCHFIGMTTLEHSRIKRTSGHDIQWTDSPCPALNFMGRCDVYSMRPMICRLWGVVEDMPCHYGCKPSPRYLTREEGFSFLRRARELSGPQSIG